MHLFLSEFNQVSLIESGTYYYNNFTIDKHGDLLFSISLVDMNYCRSITYCTVDLVRELWGGKCGCIHLNQQPSHMSEGTSLSRPSALQCDDTDVIRGEIMKMTCDNHLIITSHVSPEP